VKGGGSSLLVLDAACSVHRFTPAFVRTITTALAKSPSSGDEPVNLQAIVSSNLEKGGEREEEEKS